MAVRCALFLYGASMRPSVSTRNRHKTVGKPGFALWLWGNEARRIFCLASFLVVFLENPVLLGFSGFRITKMVTFGDEGNMAERFVEIDPHVFLDGTLMSRRVFQLTGPGTRKNLLESPCVYGGPKSPRFRLVCGCQGKFCLSMK